MKPLFIIFTFFLQQFALPAGQEFIVRNYTVEDGLPVNSINRIIQDNDGYLYFSTTDGLAQFDGIEMKIYNSGNTPGLHSNRIFDLIYIPGHDELWLLHSDGSLTRKTGSTFQPFSALKEGMKMQAVQAHPEENGDLWIATSGGVARFNRTGNRFEFPDQPLLQAYSRVIEWTREMGLITMGENGLVQLNNGTAVQLLEPDELPISFRSVSMIKQIGDETWMMGDEGAFRYSSSEGSETLFQVGEEFTHVWNVEEMNNGKLIINSSDGFYIYNRETNSIENQILDFSSSAERSNLVFKGKNGEEILAGHRDVWIDGQLVLSAGGIISGFLDRSGSLWISTLYNGVYQIQESALSNITREQIPGFENIYSVLQAHDGTIWAGSLHNGVYRISEDGFQNWTSANSRIPENTCRFLFEDSGGTLYTSIDRYGLWTYTNNNWQKMEGLEAVTNPEVTVEAMHQSGDRLLMGTTDRLVQYSGGEFSVFRDVEEDTPESLRLVRVIRENNRGTLFTGSSGYGLSMIREDKITNYTTENSNLASNFIRDIFVQSDDTLWVATEDRGLNRLILNAEDVPIDYKHITAQDGLIHNSLHRIIKSSDDRLWISSNSGIMSISINQLNRYADGELTLLPVLGLNEQHGMVNREANGGVQTAGVLSDDQKIYFPNQRGLTVVNLEKLDLIQPEDDLHPMIETVSFSDSTLIADRETDIQIPIGERNLRIEFTAPNFKTPGQTVFQYQLEGVNQNWETANEGREAVFTNIPPGTHTFRVEAYQPGYEGSRALASADLFIPYYFYETTWFYLAVLVLGLGLVYGGIKYRTRILERRETMLKHRVNLQTKKLKKAVEQKSRFFSGITHELKTPLSLIVSPLEDILEKQGEIPDESTRNRLHLMHRNSQRLKNLVNQILEVTKLNSDAIKLTLRPVQIDELTQQIIGQFQSKLEQEDIELVFEADSINGTLYMDTDAWERIVINLLSNAIRFSPRGSTIYVRIFSENNRVSLSVKDEGIGIEEKEAGKVFNYLYQAEGADAAEGTGIGLYLVKGLVDHMGGRIELTSKKGKGAEFTVFLQKGFAHFKEPDIVIHEPFVLQKPTIRTKTAATKESSKHEPAIDTERILIVEDNFDFRSYLQSVLAEHYEVITAPEGSEALEILKNNRADLVISDVMMPGMNGLEFVSILRKKEEYKHLPVIFLSAKNHEIDVETGLSTGADIYLSKPIQSKLLISQVAAVLRREKILRSGQINEIKNSESELAKQIREIVYRQLANPALNISMLVDALYMSRTTLYKEWNQNSDTSLNDFIKQIRLNEAKVLLTEKGFSVQEAATAVGYSDANYFSTSFKKEFGVSPSKV